MQQLMKILGSTHFLHPTCANFTGGDEAKTKLKSKQIFFGVDVEFLVLFSDLSDSYSLMISSLKSVVLVLKIKALMLSLPNLTYSILT